MLRSLLFAVGALSILTCAEEFEARMALPQITQGFPIFEALAERQVQTTCPASYTLCADQQGCCSVGVACSSSLSGGQYYPVCDQQCAVAAPKCGAGCCSIGYGCSNNICISTNLASLTNPLATIPGNVPAGQTSQAAPSSLPPANVAPTAAVSYSSAYASYTSAYASAQDSYSSAYASYTSARASGQASYSSAYSSYISAGARYSNDLADASYTSALYSRSSALASLSSELDYSYSSVLASATGTRGTGRGATATAGSGGLSSGTSSESASEGHPTFTGLLKSATVAVLCLLLAIFL